MRVCVLIKPVGKSQGIGGLPPHELWIVKAMQKQDEACDFAPIGKAQDSSLEFLDSSLLPNAE